MYDISSLKVNIISVENPEQS